MFVQSHQKEVIFKLNWKPEVTFFRLMHSKIKKGLQILVICIAFILSAAFAIGRVVVGTFIDRSNLGQCSPLFSA